MKDEGGIILITPYDIYACGSAMRYGLGQIFDNIDNCNPRTHVCSRCVHTNESCLWLCDCSQHTPTIDQLSIFSTGSTGPPLLRLQKGTHKAIIVFIGPNHLIILSVDDSSIHGTSGHSLMGRISDNTDNSNQTTHV